MKRDLFSQENISTYERLMRSLTGEMSQEGLRPRGRQARPITNSVVERVLGTEDEFLSRYQNFEDRYFGMLQDPNNRRIFGKVTDLDTEKKLGVINLSNLNYSAQKELMEQFKKDVLRMPQLFDEVGIPGIEFPSGNYFSRHLLQYDVSDSTHVGSLLLNRMFFNVDPTKVGLEAFNFGRSTMLGMAGLQRLRQSSSIENIRSLTGKIATLDVETTGVTEDSQVRQFAYKIDQGDVSGDLVLKNFMNEQMNVASVTKSGISTRIPGGYDLTGDIFGTRLGRFAAELESSGEQILTMGEGGQNFVAAAKQFFTKMSEVDHIMGHNITFDLNKMTSTLNSLEAFHADEEAKALHTAFYSRIDEQKDFIIDTAETARSYFKGKVDSILSHSGIQNTQERATKIVSQLLGPETIARIGIGGSITPSSMENIVLNTNLLQLIENNELEGSDKIIDLIRTKGTHTADVDTALQASMIRAMRDDKLQFRFLTEQISGIPELTQYAATDLSDFEKYARNLTLKSQALTPTTNVSSVATASSSLLDYSMSQEGMRYTTMLASQSDLGLEGAAQGFLSYDMSAGQYKFRQFGQLDEGIQISDQIAEGYIRSTIQQARTEGEGTLQELRVGSAPPISVTRNLFDEKILRLPANMLENTAIERVKVISQILNDAGVNEATSVMDAGRLVGSLGLTTRVFGESTRPGASLRSIIGTIDRPIKVASSAKVTDEAMLGYARATAEAGLPFSRIDPVYRAMSVGLASLTARIGESNATGAVQGRNARLTADVGISFFRTQNIPRIGEIVTSMDLTDPTKAVYDLSPSSVLLAPFQSLFGYEEATDAANQVVSQKLVFKPFSGTGLADDITTSDLNRFTLSYVKKSITDAGEVVQPRLNLIFGMGMGEEEAKTTAEHLLNMSSDHRDLIKSLNLSEGELRQSLAQMPEVGQYDDITRSRIVGQLSEHIRARGIGVGFVEGEDVVQQFLEMVKNQGVDLTQNDALLKELAMRIGHFDERRGVIAMSAMSSTVVDRVMGRTSEKAQEETVKGLNVLRKIDELLENSSTRRQAVRNIAEANNLSDFQSGLLGTAERLRAGIPTPMTDFYVKNKAKIGFAGLGLAAAGIGYYIAKKNRESDLYNQTMEAQPLQTSSGGVDLQRFDASFNNSTRRDPLGTAGVVGDLDRSKVGHHKMGPNKYDHLYGG